MGRKAGAAYYRYIDVAGKLARQADSLVHGIIAAESAAKGITRREFRAEGIQRRAMLTLVNEAALAMEDRVAQRAEDIDVVLVNGYGFPR